MSYPVPENEVARNEALRSYQIMDSAPEIAFDEIGELAAEICHCPIAYVNFIEDDRSWFKAKYGLPQDFVGCPREISFCSVTICGTDIVLAPDLTKDERYHDFQFVINEPHLKFYCGVPLINPDGYALGTLCVMDFEARELTFEQQEAMLRLSHQVVGQLELRRKLIELGDAMRELEDARESIAAEKARAEELLTNILPKSIADELRANGKVAPRHFPSATILFSDFRNFTTLAERAEPAMLIGLLDQYFGAFDEIVARHGLEKIKTIGDAYMAVAGVPNPSRLHTLDACMAALKMQDMVAQLKAQRDMARLPSLELRIGIHTGSVIAGVVGRHKFTYDLWGDSVNVAARLEANSEPGRINVSEQVYNHVKSLFDATARGSIEVKNKAPVAMYFLDRLKPDLTKDPDGRQPNERFAAERERLATGFAGWSRSPSAAGSAR
jgi:class 3 adenylate cyclase